MKNIIANGRNHKHPKATESTFTWKYGEFFTALANFKLVTA